jgi:competence protein ComEC
VRNYIHKVKQYFETYEQERLFLFSPVLFATGISFYFSLSVEPSYIFSCLLFVLGALPMIFYRVRFKQFSYLLTGLFLLFAGFFTVHTKVLLMKSPIIEPDLNVIWVRGDIEKIEQREYGKKLILKNVDLWQPEVKKFADERTPKKIILHSRIKQEETFRTGDRIQVKAIINPPEKLPVFPESYNFGRTSYFAQIGGSGFTISPIKKLKSGDVKFTEKLRHKLADRLFENGVNDKNAITYGMLTGDDKNISKETMQAVRDAGLGHILAVSGLHMSIVMAGLFFLIRFCLAAIPRISLYYDIKKISAVIVIIIGYYYLQFTNFPVSAERSYIMVVIFFMAMLFDRSNTTMRQVAIAGMMLLVIKPEALFDAGFQMSFAAVAGLIFLYEISKDKNEDDVRLERKFYNSFWQRAGKYLLFLVISSLVAGLATTPYSFYHFGRYSNYSVLANLIAIPVSTYIIMPVCFIAFIFLDTPFFPFLADAANFTSIWLKDIAEWSTSFPNPVVMKPYIPISYVWFATLLMCWLFFFQSKIRFYALPFLVILFFAFFNNNNLPELIISEKNFAIKGNDRKFYFSNRRKSFQNAVWQGKLAVNEQQPLKNISKDCNAKNCKFGDILITKQLLREDVCSSQKYIINLGKSNACEEKTIIDINRLQKSGTHLIWRVNDGLELKSMRDIEGKRPWNM